MRYALPLVLAALFLVAPDAALAQTGQSTQTTTQRVDGRWAEFREREERRLKDEDDSALGKAEKERGGMYRYEDKQAVLADFADCAIKQAPERVSALLATAPDSSDEAKALRGFTSMEACTRGRMFVSARTGEIRGAFAEVALKRDAARLATLVTRAATPPTPIAERAAGTRRFVVAYSHCLATADPAKAVAVLSTTYRSDEETAAMLAIGEPLKQCMPAGVAYQLNIRDVRNHIADALYQLGGVPRA
jgi:hypothetical protein